MNCLLVVPRTTIESSRSQFPLGISYISAAMRRIEGINTVIVNFNLNRYDHTDFAAEIISIIESEKIQAVLCGGLYADLFCMRDVFKAAKAYKPSIATISGGPIISGDPIPAMTALENVDYGIIGEGERTVTELCLALKERAAVSGVNGLIIKQGQGFNFTPPREIIESWSEIPWPDYEGIGQNGYSQIIVASSRGCPFSCTFCHNSQGKKYRPRPLDDFFDELDHIRKTYPGLRIVINDDLLAESKPRLEEFCRRIIAFGLEHWQCSLRVPQVDERTIELLLNSGCSFVTIGLESASDRILASMNKKITLKDIERATEALSRGGMPFFSNFIFGDTEETWEAAMETLAWWDAHPEYTTSLLMIRLFPGSALYRKAVTEGKIKDPVRFLVEGLPSTNVSRMTEEEYRTLEKLLGEKMAGRSATSRFQLLDISIDSNVPELRKTVKGVCVYCGTRIEATTGLLDCRLRCPECNGVLILPSENCFEINPSVLAANIEKLVDRHGSVAFWGIGRVFRELVDEKWLDRPEITLVDKAGGGIVGDKKIEEPAVISERSIRAVVVSISPTIYNYQVVLNEAVREHGAETAVSIYQLLSDEFFGPAAQ